MTNDARKCRHGRSLIFCVKCNYGNTGRHDIMRDEDNPPDLIDEMEKTTKHQKLKEGFSYDQ